MRSPLGKPTWQALLDRYEIDGAVVDYVALPRMVLAGASGRHALPGANVPAARSSLYFAPERFALVYWDDVAMLFVRRSSDREGKTREQEYSVVRPDEPGLLIAQARDDERLRNDAIEELERRVGVTPRSGRAESLLESLRALGN